MEARADSTLTSKQLRGFINAFGVSKRDQLSKWRPPLRMRGENPRAAYEDHRDVATAAMQALGEGRAIFDEAKMFEWARQADIPQDVAFANMPLFQQAVARGTAAYCIKIANDLRPAEPQRSKLTSWFFGPQVDYADVKYDTLVAGFGRVNSPAGEKSGEAPSAGRSSVAVIDGEDAVVTASPACDLVNADPPSTEAHRSDRNEHVRSVEPPVTATEDSIAAHQPADIPLIQSLGLPATTDAKPVTFPPPAHPGNNITIGRFFDQFIDEQLKNEVWSESRRPELVGTKRIFLRLVGDVPLQNLTRDEVAKFRTKFLTLPVDHKNLWVYHDPIRNVDTERSYDELIGHAAKLVAIGRLSQDCVGQKAWNKHRGNLSAFLKWAKATMEAAKDIGDVFEGLHLRVRKDAAAIRLERGMAPTEAVRALLRTEIWTGRRSTYHLTGTGPIIIRDSLYWVPLMAIATGMRREECCQLKVMHIVTRSGVLCFNLFAPDLRVKADKGASRRLVPLSQALLDLGFVDALMKGRGEGELLFPELNKDNAHGAYGVSFGKRFLNYITNVEPDFTNDARSSCAEMQVSDEEREILTAREVERLVVEFRDKVCNHAFRHWFKTEAVNADTNVPIIEEIMGHAHAEQQTEGSRYFKGAYIHNLKRTIDMIPMPFDPHELRRLAEAYESSLADEKGRVKKAPARKRKGSA